MLIDEHAARWAGSGHSVTSSSSWSTIEHGTCSCGDEGHNPQRLAPGSSPGRTTTTSVNCGAASPARGHPRSCRCPMHPRPQRTGRRARQLDAPGERPPHDRRTGRRRRSRRGPGPGTGCAAGSGGAVTPSATTATRLVGGVESAQRMRAEGTQLESRVAAPHGRPAAVDAERRMYPGASNSRTRAARLTVGSEHFAVTSSISSPVDSPVRTRSARQSALPARAAAPLRRAPASMALANEGHRRVTLDASPRSAARPGPRHCGR